MDGQSQATNLLLTQPILTPPLENFGIFGTGNPTDFLDIVGRHGATGRIWSRLVTKCVQ